MGNAILFRRHHGRVKIMKLDGQVLKVKGPLIVDDILADYPGYAILHSEAVRHMGVKAKPLDGSASLNAKHLYFLVQLPKVENHKREPRRVRSGIPTNAKSRLESMLLTRRSISDISHMNCDPSSSEIMSEDNGAVRVKVRLTKAQLIEMMDESQESSVTVERILDSILNHEKSQQMERGKEEEDREEKEENLAWKPSLGNVGETCRKSEGLMDSSANVNISIT
ncbi:hypothetical protein SUGI_1073910 [Cryptomeria japonica]|uniref:uncharacterized protein At1g66480 n=1 Tax=Cryptomeria japonica TaxID=3369 RepID=UPI0024149681|nr:uncharacterized protein At1g66480 [Cryptomeria japonica]GLJ50382.1 hypothetical protein SUGI_1073910 [Cryptomeria japonica]